MADIVEHHLLAPFLPDGAKVLMVGSFPPKKERWSMDFFYPNFQNDMWRIMGEVFFGDKGRFIVASGNAFDKESIVDFCNDKGIAIYDAAESVVRLRNNASDKFLQVVTVAPIEDLLRCIPNCMAVIVTGEKSAEILASVLNCGVPSVGGCVEFDVDERVLRLYRLPSSSRAYPRSFDFKVEAYRVALSEIGLC